MNKYYRNNLVDALRIYVVGCTVLVALASSLTAYIVSGNYKKYKQITAKTYVYSNNGASILITNQNAESTRTK